ncbi:MAG: hypothetical protein HQL30_03515 [Candidatus Omnitrophica bacterium]|nr:hypothetical protein [Candidatus Omnitrophota bacterium]
MGIIKRAAGNIALLILVFVAIFILFEGTSSLVLFIRDIACNAKPPLADRLYTRYDSLLGWKSIPNTHIADMFGPGNDVTINSGSIRADKEYSKEIPSGKKRIICSGDSFTFGYGVANNDTWPSLMEKIDPGLEIINMGQCGYGIDQSYLWYEEDGVKYDHDIHIFAFITDDIRRTQWKTFQRYGKPVLRLVNNELAVENVPVPKKWYSFPWLSRNLWIMWELRSFKLLKDIHRHFFPKTDAIKKASVTIYDTPESAEGMVLKLFEELDKIGNSKLYVVYLPVYQDVNGSGSDVWRALLKDKLASYGITFIDLVPPLRNLSKEEIDKFFLKPGVLSFAYSEGHYTGTGNQYIAGWIYDIVTKSLK